MEKRGWRPAVVSILIAELVGQVGHLLAGNIGSGYAALIKPALAPPGWLFVPVWIVLYALMGYAAYRIWVSDSSKKRGAMALYTAGLLLNIIWPLIFFRLEALWPAAVLLIVLLVLTVLTAQKFSNIDRVAGRLLIPYLIWLLYAAYLNIGFAIVNG